MIEKAFVYEIEKAIPELKKNIYPTNAPKESVRPYLVYYRDRTDRLRTLEGDTGSRGIGFLFSIMAARYEDMRRLTDRAEALLLTFRVCQEICANA